MLKSSSDMRAVPAFRGACCMAVAVADISRVAGVCVGSANSATCRNASLDAKRKALPVSCLNDRMVER